MAILLLKIFIYESGELNIYLEKGIVMGTTLNNLGACASNLLTGKKYGGVLVNNKLTLVPSKRLTQFVDNAEKIWF